MKIAIVRDKKGRFQKGTNLGHPAYGGLNTRFKKGHKLLKGSEKGWFKKEQYNWGEHPNFKNGIWSYDKFKKDICEDCNSTKYLLVHHINKNRENNRKENLRTVCAKCHTIIYHPRKFRGNQYVSI